jgi:hypothetical protein
MLAFEAALRERGGDALAEVGYRPPSRARSSRGRGATPVGPQTPGGTPIHPAARWRALARTAAAFLGAVLIGVLVPSGPEPPAPTPTSAPAPTAPPAPAGPTSEELGARLDEAVEAVRRHVEGNIPEDKELDELVLGEDHPGIGLLLATEEALRLRARWFQALRDWLESPAVRERLSGPSRDAGPEAARWGRAARTLRVMGAAHNKMLRRYGRYAAARQLGLGDDVDENQGEAVAIFRDDLGQLARDLEDIPEPRPPHVDTLRALALFYQDASGRARAARAATRHLRHVGFDYYEPTVLEMLLRVVQAPLIGDEAYACDTLEGVLDDLAQSILRPVPRGRRGDARRYLAQLAATDGLIRVRCEEDEPTPIAERIADRLEGLAGRSSRAAANLRLATQRLLDGSPGPRARALAARYLVLANRLDGRAEGTPPAPERSQEQ